jgi:hypothetical protein
MLRELPFGARISDSFVKKLKWETAKASEDSPGALPCLCIEQRQRCETRRESQAKRLDFDKGLEIPPINRLIRPTPHSTFIKERVWVLCFKTRKHSPKAIFEIDGVELHISERAQAELRGATILVVNDKIVVTYERT